MDTPRTCSLPNATHHIAGETLIYRGSIGKPFREKIHQGMGEFMHEYPYGTCLGLESDNRSPDVAYPDPSPFDITQASADPQGQAIGGCAGSDTQNTHGGDRHRYGKPGPNNFRYLGQQNRVSAASPSPPESTRSRRE